LTKWQVDQMSWRQKNRIGIVDPNERPKLKFCHIFFPKNPKFLTFKTFRQHLTHHRGISLASFFSRSPFRETESLQLILKCSLCFCFQPISAHILTTFFLRWTTKTPV
jgi:hypothetical protein